MAARESPQCDIKEGHHLLAHPSENTSRETAKGAGIIMTGEWRPCVECNQSKAHCHAVSIATDNSASEQAALLYVDLGPMEAESVGGIRYVMIIVDDFRRYRVS